MLKYLDVLATQWINEFRQNCYDDRNIRCRTEIIIRAKYIKALGITGGDL